MYELACRSLSSPHTCHATAELSPTIDAFHFTLQDQRRSLPTSIVSMLFTGSRYIVAGVTLLIAYIALTSQIFVFVPWLMSISLRRTLQVLVPFNIGVGFIYWHYYLACTTEPGSPPLGWGVRPPWLYTFFVSDHCQLAGVSRLQALTPPVDRLT